MSGAEGEAAAFAITVREALARRRMSRQELAHRAQLGLSTLEKVLSGQRNLTLATRLRIEAALELSSPPVAPVIAADPPAIAPAELGGYTRALVQDLEGDYLTLRPSFSGAGILFAYRTELLWDRACSCLVFREAEREDAHYAQTGVVSLPHRSGHVYLVTQELGQYRMAILSRPSQGGGLYGILSTLQAGRGTQLVPASLPLALVPLATMPDRVYGRLAPGDAGFDAAARILGRVVAEDYARFPGL